MSLTSTIAREVMRTLQLNLYRMDFPDTPSAVRERLEAMRDLSQQIEKLLQPTSQVKLIEGRALWESLAQAVVAIAQERRGVRLTAKDLKDLVVNHCPEPDLAFWAASSPGRAVGLLRSEPQVRKLVEARGVMFWDRWEDEQWRIVDSRWLVAHADIRRWVLTKWAGGRRCRFCNASENPRVAVLVSVNPEQRNGVQMIGETVVLQVGAALTHDACRKHWVAWTGIAAKYATDREAAAADRAAGRESRWDPLVERAALEAPAQ